MFDKDINEYPLVNEKSTRTRKTKNQRQPKVSKDEVVVEKEAVTTIEVRVIAKTKNDVTGIDFKGFGVLVSTPDKKFSLGDIIRVSYQSEIGKSDFKISLVK